MEKGKIIGVITTDNNQLKRFVNEILKPEFGDNCTYKRISKIEDLMGVRFNEIRFGYDNYKIDREVIYIAYARIVKDNKDE